MQSVGTTEWLVNRRVSKGFIGQTSTVAGHQAIRELIIPALQWVQLIPSWVLLTTVLLATCGICGTVIIRSRAQLRASVGEQERIVSEIGNTREANRILQLEIQRLTEDPNTIELAARERLGMVKVNDIVVTMGSIHKTSSNADLVSFVR